MTADTGRARAPHDSSSITARPHLEQHGGGVSQGAGAVRQPQAPVGAPARQLLERRRQGMAILLVSTELDEILALSDRILVMYEGRAMGLAKAEETTREILAFLANR